MEYFPATNENQIDYIKKLLDDVDFLVLIIGNCYGSIDSEGVSFTEREFEYAIKNNIPIFAFLNNDFKPEANKTEIKKFREKVCTGRVCKFWSTPIDLKAQIISSLANKIRSNPPGGWVIAKETDLYTLPSNIFFSDDEPINAEEGDIWIGE